MYQKTGKNCKLTFCIPDCEFLSPTEMEQNEHEKIKIYRDYWKHVCAKYNKQVFHMGFHPQIIAIKGCKFSIRGEK